ncbi:MAG: glycosyltransferase family 1 protein [Cyanobacteria bacterium REEB67]|nr:glycosyltransferase family 1 protein [Cyanobacteria bacterium REEB67]
MMKIAIITDAWHPQVNGVVRTHTHLIKELRQLGHEVRMITPDLFSNFPCPTYPEIRLAYNVRGGLKKYLSEFNPDAVHISTEGPLGIAARRLCLKQCWPFTTAYHTRFPEYLKAKAHVPETLTYYLMRRFHAPSKAVMVPTESMQMVLEKRGFSNVKQWTRGVDTQLFKPRDKSFLTLPRPIFAYIGRVSVEKNIGAFLDLQLPGSKLVVGDGPQLKEMQKKYPQVTFVGSKSGEELAQHYAAADVFVFPSRTDTFGLVVLEALASGLPVAAYPVTGPRDIIGNSTVGCLDDDLQAAAMKALTIDPQTCRAFAEARSWKTCADQFLRNLNPRN